MARLPLFFGLLCLLRLLGLLHAVALQCTARCCCRLPFYGSSRGRCPLAAAALSGSCGHLSSSQCSALRRPLLLPHCHYCAAVHLNHQVSCGQQLSRMCGNDHRPLAVWLLLKWRRLRLRLLLHDVLLSLLLVLVLTGAAVQRRAPQQRPQQGVPQNPGRHLGIHCCQAVIQQHHVRILYSRCQREHRERVGMLAWGVDAI